MSNDNYDTEKRKNPFPKQYPCYCGSQLIKDNTQYTCTNKKCWRHNNPIHGAIRTGYDEFDCNVKEIDVQKTNLQKVEYERDEDGIPYNVCLYKRTNTASPYSVTRIK